MAERPLIERAADPSLSGFIPVLEAIPLLPDPETPETPAVVECSRPGRIFNAIKRSGQGALVAVELSPANEAIRGGLFVAGEAVTRDPIVGGLTIGLSTFIIESAGGLAAAGLFDTDNGKSFIAKVNNKLAKLKVSDRKLAPTTKAGATFLGGTVVGMALEQREDPDRTLEQNRKYGLVTSAWLAGVCAVVGVLASEGIDIGLNDPKSGGIIVGSTMAVAAAGRQVKKRFPKPREMSLVKDETKLEKAAVLEQAVWYEKGYGSLDEYQEHIADSRTFASFDGEECVGVVRIFGGSKNLPPFVELPFYDEDLRESIAEECKQGVTEELGTIAVATGARNGLVSKKLWRMAYRDAHARRIKSWGIVMEPERVQKMNKHFGFTFRQLGPTVDYQGGMCAPHIMEFKEVDKNMRENFPKLADWFANQPLDS